MTPPEIEKKLKNLNSLHKLRSFLAELGFSPTTEKIYVEHEELKDIKLTKIAESDIHSELKYPIILIETVIIDSPRAGIELSRIERKIFPMLGQFKEALLITVAKDFKRIHLTNVKPYGKRSLFRRFAVGEGERYRTTSERLTLIKIEPDYTYEQVKGKIEKAFDVEAVTDKFFKEFQEIFELIRERLEKQNKGNLHQIHNFTHQIFSRIMFLYFLQRMEWLGNGNQEFMMHLWTTYKNNKNENSNFYNNYLKPLFFGALCNKYTYRENLPEEINNFYIQAPYLNGGLFKETDLDKLGFIISDQIFENIFGSTAYPGFLQRYNFTIQEESPWDINVAVDPAMIGKVYESLTFTHEERGEAGIFYTPRIEIDFMCRTALLDYLKNNLPEIPERNLYKFIFYEDKEIIAVKFEKEEYEKLKNTLKTITILDPAVGSASFLIGMLEILTTLLEYLAGQEGQEITSQFHYELKKQIVEQSLYGVDVMNWAIQVAQLRIWLQLIIDCPDELKESQEPILPSLSYKLRVGDSLVQEIGEYKFKLPLQLKEARLASWISEDLNKLKKRKFEHYENKVKKIIVDNLERKFFIDILRNQREYLEKEISKKQKVGEQESLLETTKHLKTYNDTSNKKIIENLEKKIAKINKVYNSIQNKKELPFVWGIGFAEIFSGKKEGFDIVIGNPPYVRQEKIANPLQDNPTLEQRREYKKKLLEFVQHYWKKGLYVKKRADYYVYFYLIGLALLNSMGSFCFITSNSWLDAGYGKELQEFLLRKVKIKAIYDNQAKRTFASASINTIIASFSAKVSEEEAFQNKARFVMFKNPFEEVLFEENIWAIDHTLSRTTTDDYCMRIYKQEEIFKDGSKEIKIDKVKWDKTALDYHYVGNKWGGKYLRAPDIFYTILEKGKGKLVRLGDIAEVSRGFTTGCNEFFYLPSKHFDIKKEGKYYRLIPKYEGLPDDLRIEEEYLKPVIKSPRECKSIFVNPKDLKYKVLMCHKSREELRRTKSLGYIKWGEKQNFHKRQTCVARKKWYELKQERISEFIFKKGYGDFFAQNLNKENYFIDQTFYVWECDNPEFWTLYLNSTFFVLFLEASTSIGLGGGLLRPTTDEMEEIVVPDLNNETIVIKEFTKFFKRPIKSIFKECGFNRSKPIREQEPNPLPDRKMLDDVVFGILGLTQEERDEVYWAVCELVKNRLEKAKSV